MQSTQNIMNGELADDMDAQGQIVTNYNKQCDSLCAHVDALLGV